jgi:hypothetical protein
MSIGNEVEVAVLLQNGAGVDGENQLAFDATDPVSGQALPIGVYRVIVTCTDPQGSRSSPATDPFSVVFGG